ncbi:MAG TPA: hypothetical protein VLE22_02195 [Bryobacteraceae bacterium]|nr:hypothetical protein [Bryobacteraceae bacterium]
MSRRRPETTRPQCPSRNRKEAGDVDRDSVLAKRRHDVAIVGDKLLHGPEPRVAAKPVCPGEGAVGIPRRAAREDNESPLFTV